MRKVLYNSRQFAYTRAIPWLQAIWMQWMRSFVLRWECPNKPHIDTYWNKGACTNIFIFSFLFPTSLATMMPAMLFVLIKKFNCEDCGKCFTTANILQQHRKKHSTPVRPHKCSDCPAAFYTQNDLRIHFLTHTRERMYLCCQCGKRFSRKTHLNIHLSEFIVVPFPIQALCWVFMDFFVFLAGTHSGLKPFHCSICQKSFAISGDLTAHMRVCHILPCN